MAHPYPSFEVFGKVQGMLNIVHRDAPSLFQTAPCMKLVYKKSKGPLKKFSLERETPELL